MKEHVISLTQKERKPASFLTWKHNSVFEPIDDYYCQKEYDSVKVATDAEISQGDFVTLDQLKMQRRN